MGTGIVSILLHQLPYTHPSLLILSYIVFGLNTVLFTLAFLVSLARYILYPEIWTVMIRHPTQSLFLGTLPMGFATLINMLVLACVPAWGDWAITLAWTLWWIDAAVSVGICCGLAWFMYADSIPPPLPTYTALIDALWPHNGLETLRRPSFHASPNPPGTGSQCTKALCRQ